MPRTPRPAAALVALLALLVSLVAATGTAGAQGAPEPSPAATPERPGSRGALSPRLAALTAPGLATASAATQAAAAGLPSSGPGSLLRDGRGRLVVDVTLRDRSASGVASLTSVGAEVVATDDGPVLVTVTVPTDAIGALASLPTVAYVTEVPAPMRAAEGGGPIEDGPLTDATCPTGVLTEGDAQLRADLARATYGVDGTGIEVGVLSDSYDNLGGAATDVTDAELPGAANPCGATTPVGIQEDLGSGGTDEGRAMAQIVHDLAPGAELTFATAFLGELDFASQITDLGIGGADVITDDVFYLTEPMFQDGFIAAAINDNRTARDVLHFSSGGNSNKIIGGKDVASYEAPAFRPTTCPAGIPAYNNACHDFDTGAGTDGGDGLTLSAGGSVRLGLGWSEPMYGVTTDLDLYLVDTTTNAVVASSETDNSSSAKANEYLAYTNSTGATRTFDVVVGRFNGSPDPTGTPRIKHVLFRATGLTAVEYDTSTGGDVVGPTLVGHSAAALAMGTAAVPFFSSSSVESFSSRGPANICWEPVDGATPQPALSPCDVVRPDLAATDGGANSFFGSFTGGAFRFFGTSAAAPHAAAVAALVRQVAPCATADQVATALTDTAVAVGAFGVDVVGAGLVDADAAVGALAALCSPTISGTVTVDGTGDPAGGITVAAYTDADGFTPSAATTTAADGTYVLTGLAEEVHRVAFVPAVDDLLDVEWWDDAPDRATATVIDLSGGGATTGIDAALAPVGSLAGTVTADAGGAPVAGATVAVFGSGATWFPTATATTAADGTFTIGYLAPDDYEVTFRGPTGSLLTTEWYDDELDRTVSTPVTVSGGAATTGVDAALAESAGLAGTITAPGGAPVAGATVVVFDIAATWFPTATATTAGDGTYSVGGLPAGTYQVRLLAPAGSGLASEWWDGSTTRAGSTPVVLTTGATALDAELAGDESILGTISASGSPLAGATVAAFAPGQFGASGTATTGADGTYALVDLPPDTYQLRITAPGHVTEWYDDSATRGGATSLVVAVGSRTTGIDAALTPVP